MLYACSTLIAVFWHRSLSLVTNLYKLKLIKLHLLPHFGKMQEFLAFSFLQVFEKIRTPSHNIAEHKFQKHV